MLDAFISKNFLKRLYIVNRTGGNILSEAWWDGLTVATIPYSGE